MLSGIDSSKKKSEKSETKTPKSDVFKKSMSGVMKEVEVLAKNTNVAYGGAFVRAATLIPNVGEKSVEKPDTKPKQQKQVVKNSSDDDDESSSSSSDSSDEDEGIVKSKVLDPKMFEACEGRTLRKWKQEGKQKRLEQFDAQFKQNLKRKETEPIDEDRKVKKQKT